MRTPARLLFVLGPCCLAACFAPPVLPPRDAPVRDTPRRVMAESLAVRGVRALDASGREWPLEAIPRQPRLVIETTAGLAPEDDVVLLVRGELDEQLRDDAARRPLTQATLARAVEVDRSYEAAALVLTAREALAPGEALTLVIAGFARSVHDETLGEPVLQSLRVSIDPSAGASVVRTIPADGTLDVPTNAEPFVLALDGHVAITGLPALARTSAGVEVVLDATLARCEGLGLDATACLALRAREPLPSATTLIVETTDDLRDATGASVRGARLEVTTSLGPDVEPPVLGADVSCAVDAVLLAGVGCVTASDRRWSLELSASEPARFELAGPHGILRAMAPRGHATLSLDGLAPDARLPATLTAIDLAGLRTSLALEIATTPELAPITITEVCADPEGPEPAQEWIEIANVGDEPASLEGLSLSDRADAIGAIVPSSRVLVPGARVLLVGEGFDAGRAGAPDGAPLVIVGRTLVPSGLSNAGEDVFLRDAMGRRLARVPAIAGRAGACVVRREGSDPRADAITDFLYSPCTPGR